MYVKTIINGKPSKVMLDKGADTVYMAKELADKVGLFYTKEKGFVKGANVRSLPIEGVARGTLIQIGQWRGKGDITVAPLDDKQFYFGIDFLSMVKALLVSHTNTMYIMKKGKPCVVPMKREIDENKMLSALQFTKEIKRKEPTFLTTLKLGEAAKEVQGPNALQKVLDEFKDVMPAKLSKRLFPTREVNHALSWSLGQSHLHSPSTTRHLEARGAKEAIEGAT